VTARRAPVVLLLLAASAWGAVRAGAADAPPAPGERLVGLRECVQAAATRHPALRRARLARDQAALDVERARAGFYPVLSFQLGYGDTRWPGEAGEPPEQSQGLLSYDAGVLVDTPLGTQLRAALTNRRLGTSDPGAALDPEHRAGLELGLTQPLLRGLGLGPNLSGWNQARLQLRAAAAELRGALNALALEAEQAYWTLSLAQQEVEIAARSLARARQQLEDTQENIRRGLLPDADLYVVEESQVRFQTRLLQAQNRLAAARSRLGEVMRLEPEAARGLRASEAPEPGAVRLPSEYELLAAGFQDCPALLVARARAEAAGVALAYAEDRRLPRLDLEASFRLNGLTGSLGATWEELWGFGRTDAFLGLSLEVPLFDALDGSGVERADLEVARALLGMQEAEQRLRFEVHDLRRDIGHRLEVQRLARRVSELARLKLEAQQDKYAAGISALKDVVQFLRELDQAELEEAEALVELAASAAALRAVVGDLHLAHGIEVR